MSDKLKQFHAILEDMFQLNQADLDFGIYRIMNQKRQEINRFLNDDLVPQVEAAFTQAGGENKALLERELEKLVYSLREAGATPDMIRQMPKVKELQERLSATEQGTGALADEVFSHLTNFFRRYYKEGDFISLPRYKDGVYAIPYNGEEVKLHWANSDQYYIKTTEYFRDYAFRLENGKVVHFKIVDASTEQDNNKAQTDKERRFILARENTVSIENDELIIRFVYQIMKEKQNKLNLTTLKILQGMLSSSEFTEFSGVWHLMPTEKDSKRTLLEKHLNDYTAKNSFDYFIHKNLGGFLRRELDFYIKNEVIYLDDLDTDNEVKAQQYLNKVKVIKRIGQKIIAFLAQLEDFQKKLWLKKKFVVETNYCLTLDRVPEEFYEIILANNDQLAEWKRLFVIEEIEGYSEPLTADFLQSNLYLVLDTCFYSQKFRERLISSIDDIDGKTDGLLVQSENFQALQLLHLKYENEMKCIYIDPPYNTDASTIPYKNNYQHSSWLALMSDRLKLGRELLNQKGITAVTIDEFELKELYFITESIYGRGNISGVIAIRSNPSGRPTTDGLALAHEYAIIAKNSQEAKIPKIGRTEEQASRYDKKDKDGVYEQRNFRREGSNSDRENGKRQWYPIYVNLNTFTIRIPNMKWNDDTELWDIMEQPFENETVTYPITDNGVEKNWRWSWENVMKDYSQFYAKRQGTNVQVYYKYRPNEDGITPLTFWADSKYSATEHGTKTLKDLLPGNTFFYPKSIFAVQDTLSISGLKNGVGTVLDYFAGSGTTAHAVINLNREDNGSRKYILVEMGEYFDSVTKPRIQKVIYSKDWKDGKPVSRVGSSHMFKYIRLESYEDTLNNLELRRTEAQQIQLDMHDKVREEYLLSYMLDLESQDSPSLLNLESFRNPFEYKLNITRQNESRPVVVDLPETLNYLLGLTIRQSEIVRDFKVIRGELPSGERALIIWRNLNEKSNQDLEDFLDRSGYNPRDNEFDRIYVNGDNHIENRRTEGERWKVLLIEEEFKRLMFDSRDI